MKNILRSLLLVSLLATSGNALAVDTDKGNKDGEKVSFFAKGKNLVMDHKLATAGVVASAALVTAVAVDLLKNDAEYCKKVLGFSKDVADQIVAKVKAHPILATSFAAAIVLEGCDQTYGWHKRKTNPEYKTVTRKTWDWTTGLFSKKKAPNTGTQNNNDEEK